MAVLHDHGRRTEGCRGTEDCSHVVGIGDLIENHHEVSGRHGLVQSEVRELGDLDGETLVNCAAFNHTVELLAVDDFG